MFQICVPNQKIQGMELMLHSWNFFLMQWFETSKHTIFLILLKFQILWNLINVLIKKHNENIYLNVSFFKKSLRGSIESRCDVPNGTTQGWVCPMMWKNVVKQKMYLGD